MIQIGTHLKILDNSGATEAYCIRILGGYKKRYASLGEKVLLVISKLRSKRKDIIKIKKGEIYFGLVTHINKPAKTSLGSVKNFNNSAILLTKQSKALGSKIFGGIHKAFRYTKFLKIVFLGSGIIR